MALEIRSRKTSGVLIVDVLGRLNVLERTLWTKIDEFINQGERHLVLNLTDLEYIDAAGLGQLVAIWTSVTNSGGRVALLQPRERVRKLLSITRLDTVFEVFEEEVQAMSRGYSGPSATTPHFPGYGVSHSYPGAEQPDETRERCVC
jgi:anti-sigma B factor antagonist